MPSPRDDVVDTLVTNSLNTFIHPHTLFKSKLQEKWNRVGPGRLVQTYITGPHP